MTFAPGKSGNPKGQPRKFPKGTRSKLKTAITSDKTGLGIGPASYFTPSPGRIAELKKRAREIAKIEIEDAATVERYKQILIMAISDGLCWQTACQILGLRFQTFQEWREADPDFAEMLLHASACSIARLKDKAYEVALKGSETMLKTLLMAYDPETFAKPVLKASGDVPADSVVAMLQAVGRTLDARQPEAPKVIEHQANGE